MRSRIQAHVRRTFLAGVFAAVPVAVTAFIIWYINAKTIGISEWLFGRPIPFAGVLIALASIYVCGIVATTLLGRLVLRIVDRLLSSVPLLRPLYTAWKQVALTPGGT